MSDLAIAGRGGWFGLISSSAAAVIVGFASTILLIMEAARAVGASPAQQASWAASLCFGMAVTSLTLSWRYRIPVITAWATPGAARVRGLIRQPSLTLPPSDEAPLRRHDDRQPRRPGRPHHHGISEPAGLRSAARFVLSAAGHGGAVGDATWIGVACSLRQPPDQA